MSIQEDLRTHSTYCTQHYAEYETNTSDHNQYINVFVHDCVSAPLFSIVPNKACVEVFSYDLSLYLLSYPYVPILLNVCTVVVTKKQNYVHKCKNSNIKMIS